MRNTLAAVKRSWPSDNYSSSEDTVNSNNICGSKKRKHDAIPRVADEDIDRLIASIAEDRCGHNNNTASFSYGAANNNYSNNGNGNTGFISNNNNSNPGMYTYGYLYVCSCVFV